MDGGGNDDTVPEIGRGKDMTRWTSAAHWLQQKADVWSSLSQLPPGRAHGVLGFEEAHSLTGLDSGIWTGKRACEHIPYSLQHQ